MDWGAFGSAFGGAATALATVGWLGKTVIDHWLTRAGEEHRIQMQAEYDTDRQKALVTLETEAHALRDKTATLHARRLEVLETLYKKLIETKGAAEAFLNPLELTGSPNKQELLKPVIQKFNDLWVYFLHNKIYFGPSTCDRIEAAILAIREPARKFSFVMNYSMIHPEQAREKYKHWQAMWEQFNRDAPAAIDAVADDFRELLGV